MRNDRDAHIAIVLILVILGLLFQFVWTLFHAGFVPIPPPLDVDKPLSKSEAPGLFLWIFVVGCLVLAARLLRRK